MWKGALVGVCVGWMLIGSPATYATYSIVACDAATKRCGVAMATHNLAVGHGAPFAQAGVGAGVSQFETNPCHAASVLSHLRDGKDAGHAVQRALEDERACRDGLDASFRQLGVVRVNGDGAVHTGSEAGDFAGHRIGQGVAVLGNGLASDAVLDAMLVAYERTNAELAERLMSALEAGHTAGGQTIGVLSAALLVRTSEGWPVDIDLRVDFSQADAVSELRSAYNANKARRLMFQAARTDDDARALEIAERAVQLAPTWDRIWKRAAELASQLGDKTRTRRYQCGFQQLNPVWAHALGWHEACVTPRPEPRREMRD